nr:MAG TPA: hypothetical protein [Caudoviricetes sp.]
MESSDGSESIDLKVLKTRSHQYLSSPSLCISHLSQVIKTDEESEYHFLS